MIDPIQERNLCTHYTIRQYFDINSNLDRVNADANISTPNIQKNSLLVEITHDAFDTNFGLVEGIVYAGIKTNIILFALIAKIKVNFL